ncbi:hypothetical protein QA541_05260 [Macrococcus psychrotolerans]|uniref:Uncharacterized protein n=1 Tax=Macrococcus psychrotolerans TaxID=3039389 RepID=A0AAU6RCI9_9STAP
MEINEVKLIAKINIQYDNHKENKYLYKSADLIFISNNLDDLLFLTDLKTDFNGYGEFDATIKTIYSMPKKDSYKNESIIIFSVDELNIEFYFYYESREYPFGEEEKYFSLKSEYNINANKLNSGGQNNESTK